MKKVLFMLFLYSLTFQLVKAQEELFVNDSNMPGLQSNLMAPDVTTLTIHSEWVNDNFKLFISFPEDYDPSREMKYPVVYFLDGGGGSFHTIMAELMQAQLIPDVITIGIGYPGTSQRDRDYTYSFMNFYHFMKEELIPQMDEQFYIDPMNRTLFGHSYGGICALFTMFQYFDYNDILFHNIVAASPSIWYPDGQLSYQRESLLHSQTSVLPVNLYMTVGSFEGSMVTDMQRMQQVLENREYMYFNGSYHVNQGKDHTTNKEQTFRDGIPWVLRQDNPLSTHSTILAQGSIGKQVYPNPVTEQVTIELQPKITAQHINYRVIDVMGKELKTERIESASPDRLQFFVSGFSKGIYIVQLSEGSIHQNLKFVKQ